MKGRQFKKPGIRKLARGVEETLRWVGASGYTRHSRVHYSAAPYPLSDHLPDLSLMKLGDISGELNKRMPKDKLLFIAKHLRTPEILASVEKGKLYPHAESAGVSDPKISDLKTLADYCETSSDVILKQSNGRAGMGGVGLDVERGRWQVNSKEASADAVETLIARLDNYLVTSRVPQAASAASIFSHPANSVRTVTRQDLDRGGEPFVVVAYQKFGSLAPVPADNWSVGGFRSVIELETGKFKPVIKKYLKKKSRQVLYERHPEPGERIAGVTMPGWAQLKAQLLAILTELSFLRLVGWDVLIQDDGFCLLEGNTRPSLISLQATRPILCDDRARKFLTRHGSVRVGAR